MILVDTSVWIDHFSIGDKVLRELLNNSEVAIHTDVSTSIMQLYLNVVLEYSLIVSRFLQVQLGVWHFHVRLEPAIPASRERFFQKHLSTLQLL